MITIPIYCYSVESDPWYDPAPQLLNNLKNHIAARTALESIRHLYNRPIPRTNKLWFRWVPI